LRQLQEAGQIDYLMLSQRNIGKIGALRLLFEAAPGEVIAYNDDDILFYPGWLEACLQILDAFPKAGMVSAVPVRNASRHACLSLERFAQSDTPGLSAALERRIPDEWETDWALSTGRDPQAHLQATRDWSDLVFKLEKPGGSTSCEAIGSANHFQFVAPKDAILGALPVEWSGKLMGAMIEMDEAMDSRGYLRLSTVSRYARHLGNALDAQALAEARKLGLYPYEAEASPAAPAHTGRARRRHPLLRLPGGRHVLIAIYKRIFDILYR
jgi:hypothetical protein